MIPGMPTVIPPGLTREQERAYIGKYIASALKCIFRSLLNILFVESLGLYSFLFEELWSDDFDVIHKFLLCESCICSSLFWSVGNSSVLHECQKGRGACLGMRIVPSPAPTPTLFSCCSLPIDEVSVTCPLTLAPVENTAGIVNQVPFFTAWPFTIISYSSFP